MSPLLCLCSATLSTSALTCGRGGVVMSMWVRVGMDSNDGMDGPLPLPWWPSPEPLPPRPLGSSHLVDLSAKWLRQKMNIYFALNTRLLDKHNVQHNEHIPYKVDSLSAGVIMLLPIWRRRRWGGGACGSSSVMIGLSVAILRGIIWSRPISKAHFPN